MKHHQAATDLVTAGASTCPLTHTRQSAAHLAAANKMPKLLKVLVETGVDIQARDENGQTALHLAAEAGHETCASTLVSAKCNVSCQDSQGHNALHLAASNRHSRIVEVLLKSAQAKKASQGLDNDQRCALHCASAVGDIKSVKDLVARGTAKMLHAVDVDGWSCLHWAADGGKSATMGVLLELSKKRQLKHEDESFRFLDPMTPDHCGRLALHCAAQGAHPDATKMLLAAAPQSVNVTDLVHRRNGEPTL